MRAFPRTSIEGLSVSRMIIGTNWFFGWSHTSRAKDAYIKSTMTTDKIASVIEVFLEAGVDTMMGQIQHPGMKEAVTEAEQRSGRKITFVSTPGLNVGERPEDFDQARRTIERDAELGAAICMPHTSSTDSLVDTRLRRITNMDRYCHMVRDCGMLPGLSTHMPEAIVLADQTGLDVATYISIYNAAGFLMSLEVDWVHRTIWNARHPVMTIKPMAAGRLLPLVGLAFAWATLRDQDMVTVGTMTPDEAREVIEISLSILDRRPAAVDLQTTRSKRALVGG
jgi:hypothetical protein